MDVVCAVIKEDDKYYIFQRNNNGLWEFPGGKVEKGESYEDAIRRELFEEMEVNVIESKYIDYVSTDKINLHALKVKLEKHIFILKDHSSVRLVEEKDLLKNNLSEADVMLVNKLFIK